MMLGWLKRCLKWLLNWNCSAMPIMSKLEVIEELEYDILIHEYWAVRVIEEPKWAETMGDYKWHLRWMQVYQAAIYYLKKSPSRYYLKRGR